MSKLTGRHSIFVKADLKEQTLVTLTFARSLGRWRCLKPRMTDLVVIEGHLISQLYMDEVVRSVVLLFCAKNSDSTRPKKTRLEYTSLESARTM